MSTQNLESLTCEGISNEVSSQEGESSYRANAVHLVGHAAVSGQEGQLSPSVLSNEIHVAGAISQLSGSNWLRVDAAVPRIHQ